MQTQYEKAKHIISNGGGDEHTTVYLKLEAHLGKIRKLTGKTMLLKLCDIQQTDINNEQKPAVQNDQLSELNGKS